MVGDLNHITDFDSHVDDESNGNPLKGFGVVDTPVEVIMLNRNDTFAVVPSS